MRNIIVMILLFALMSWNIGFTKDNIYGDYLFSSFEKTVSLDLENANLMDVLKMLSKQTQLNFISTEVIRERLLTLYLDNVPLKQAMDTIFLANNLSYDYYPESKIFVIKELGKPTIELKTKVYRLKYARVSTSKLEEEKEALLKPDCEGEEEDSGGEEGATDGITAAVQALLTEYGRTIEDSTTNSLIVVDVPSQFPMIDAVIRQLDVAVQRVMIEVEMLDVKKVHLEKIGFDYANGINASFTPGTRTSSFPFDYIGGAASGNPGTGAITLGTLALNEFTAVFKMITEDTATKFLARPKILTLANQTAEVKLVSNEAIGITTSVSEGVTTQEIERDETGTKLRVTPQVSSVNGEITLLVEMSNSEATDSGLAVSGMTTGNLKNVEERGAKSIVRLKDGETLFIGGLIKSQSSETITKIPLLGDIPLIGRLFRYKEKPTAGNVERELLVFLTPHVLKDNASVIGTKVILNREQANFLKDDAVRVALDNLAR